MSADTRWQDRPPTEEDMIEELVEHLSGKHPMCGYCLEEYDIRSLGIEAVNLYDDYVSRLEESDIA